MKQKSNLFIGIFRFMVDELHLSGNKLFIYAAIYSFSKNGDGVFHGSRKYLSELFGISVRTVSRTISELLAERLIIFKGETESHSKIYIANPKYFHGENTSGEDTFAKSAADVNFVNTPCQNVSTPETNCPAPLDKLSPNNKDDSLVIRNTASPAATAAKRVREENEKSKLYEKIIEKMPSMRHEEAGDNYHPSYYQSFSYYGIDGLVKLSDDQYMFLYDWIGEDNLRDYINKLEYYLKNTPGAAIRCHSHFRLLKKWLKKDLSLTEK